MKPHVDLGVHVQLHVMSKVHRPETVPILSVVLQKNRDHVLDPVSILILSQKISDDKSAFMEKHDHIECQRHKNATARGQEHYRYFHGIA